MKQTTHANKATASRDWYVIDVAEMPLGRAAAAIAVVVLGKHKPDFSNHVDTGDFVVVLNADKVKVSGAKATDKIYYRYARQPGSLKETSWREMMKKDSRRVVELAVKRMLPKNTLGEKLIHKVKIYKGAQHRHAAQKPQPFPEHVLVGPRRLKPVQEH